MNKKELFNKVKTHLLTQNAKAEDTELDNCQYLAPDGKTCAVGCLISKELYDPEIEGVNINTPNRSFDERNSLLISLIEKSNDIVLSNDDIEMLMQLQTIHDVYKITDWPTALNNLEKELFS